MIQFYSGQSGHVVLKKKSDLLLSMISTIKSMLCL